QALSVVWQAARGSATRWSRSPRRADGRIRLDAGSLFDPCVVLLPCSVLRSRRSSRRLGKKEMPPACVRAASVDGPRPHLRRERGAGVGLRLLRGHNRGLDDLLLHGRGRDDDLVEQLALGVVLRSPKNFLFRCELLKPGSYLDQGLYELRSSRSSDQPA